MDVLKRDVEYDLKVRPARHMVFYKQQRLEWRDLGSESRAEWLAGPTRIAAGGVGYQRMDELGFFIRVIEVLMEGKEDEEWQECEKVPSSLRQQPLSKISLVVVVERTIPALKVEPMHRSMVFRSISLLQARLATSGRDWDYDAIDGGNVV
ncbi:hypothetical protein CC2G_004041 [Coprinopsis cinerea AmutBmut pab1-1]|nr:hypothetical protein CC2G_004041 [Coprinopsis cinerea AmutBmut pab1-1]